MAAVAYRFGGLSLKWGFSVASAARVSAVSVESVRVNVAADTEGAPYDPTGLPVEFAFMRAGADPAAGDWREAGWDTTLIGSYVAAALVGPGTDFVLAADRYQVWVRVTDSGSDEIVVRQVGALLVE